MQASEKCDEGLNNGQTGSNCTVTCQLKKIPSCGNAVLEPGEECDKGQSNGRAGSDCTTACRIRTGTCGNGIIESARNEECDQGSENGKQGGDCDYRCHFVKLPQCGEGSIDPLTEECDAGMQNGDYSGAPCRENCMLPGCGDAILDPNEECDDGNNIDLDNCNPDCTLPRGAAPIFTANIFPTETPPAPPVDIPKNIPTPARQPTGPGLVIFLASGAAAGIGLMRRKLRIDK